MKFFPPIILCSTFFLGFCEESRAAATQEIVAVGEEVEGRTDDLFEGATPTYWSPVVGAGDAGRLAEVKEMFGYRIPETPNSGATVFLPSQDSPVFFVNFETAAPITFTTVEVILEKDRNGPTAGERAVTGVRLFGRADAGEFTAINELHVTAADELFVATVGGAFAAARGPKRIKLVLTGIEAKRLRYFRVEFDGVPNLKRSGIAGPRVLELDALAR
jgi:hypothetical protein